MAMIFYRLMQGARRHRLSPLEMVFNKLNTMFCNCIIGRGADFGPGFVLVHATGVAINGRVRGGANVTIYHQVTLGGDGTRVPTLGDDVMIGAGAKVINAIRLEDGARVAPNSVVIARVSAGVTVMGVPARPVFQARPQPVPQPRSSESDMPAGSETVG